MAMRFRYLVLLLAATSLPLEGFCIGANKPGMFLDQPGPDGKPISASAKPTKGTGKMAKGDPVVLEAREMGYDQDNEIVIARGNVNVVQGEYVLAADQITYFQRSDLMIAEGNVSLLQPTGDVLFAERAELSNAMKTGIIDEFKARLSDNSVLVARKAVRESAAVTNLTDGSYTPCNICKNMAPFWQLNADKVHIDRLDERVSYDNATFDLFGQPVFYTPYLSHPTPDAEAKSGFMPPQYSTNGNLGTVVRAPYYWRIDQDKDAVITPWYSTDGGFLLQEDYRQLTDNGSYHVQGSGTYTKKLDDNGDEIPGHDLRGHIFAKGQEQLNDTSIVGFDVQRSSDDTYLRRYQLGDQPSLFSRVFIETAEERNFASAQSVAIQGLRATDNSKTTPFVLPALQGYYETRPDDNNIRYHVSGNATSLMRTEGIDQKLLSVTVGASHPYVFDQGVILTTTVNLRQDAYQTENLPINGGLSTEDADTYRTLPQAAFEWRYPLINQFAHDSWTVEPLLLAVLQSNGGNPSTISNEDSRLLELTDTNLFSLDRVTGIDIVDSGSRLAYGARSQYMFEGGTSIDALFGQNYNVTADTPFPNSTTPDESFSDYIGRIAYNVAPWNLAYRFALDKESLTTNRNEITVTYGAPWLTISTSYRTIDKNQFLDNSKEGDLAATLPLDENWSVHGGLRRDFDIDQWVTASGGIVFKNECFNIGLEGDRVYARDRDVEPTTQVLLQVALKNLGVFGGK